MILVAEEQEMLRTGKLFVASQRGEYFPADLTWNPRNHWVVEDNGLESSPVNSQRFYEIVCGRTMSLCPSTRPVPIHPPNHQTEDRRSGINAWPPMWMSMMRPSGERRQRGVRDGSKPGAAYHVANDLPGIGQARHPGAMTL